MGDFSETSVYKLIYFRREIDKIFREFFDPKLSETLQGQDQVEVLLDVFETPEEIVMEADLPGMKKEEIQLSVLRDLIVIEGIKKKEDIKQNLNYQRLERSFGKISRLIEIPSAGDTRHIRAEYDRGILRIRLPKIRERRGQRRNVPIE